VPGGIVHNPAAPYAREMAKWEMGYSPFGPPGRPRETVGFQPWPALFYKMTRSATNGEFLVEHYKEVGSDREASEAERLGYRLGQAAAIAYVESLEQQIAVAAAERAYSERTMSDKARAEAAAADDATSAHLPEVPVTTVRRRRGPNTPKTSLTPEA
jgi:hypothetical protein